MATYTIQAPDGKTLTLEGPEGASEADVLAQAQQLYSPTEEAAVEPPAPPVAPSPSAPYNEVPQWGKDNPSLYGVAGALKETVSPLLEGAGVVGGGLLGLAGGPVGSVAGAGLGYAGAKQLTGIADRAMGDTAPISLAQQSIGAVKDVAEGAAMEAGGQVLGPVVGSLARKTKQVAGNIIPQVFGTTTGTGAQSVKTAFEAGQKHGFRDIEDIASQIKAGGIQPRESDAFLKALRKEVTGEDVVMNVHTALTSLKDARKTAYLQDFDKAVLDAAGNPIPFNIKPVVQDVLSVLDREGVKMLPNGKFDMSAVGMGTQGKADIAGIYNTVKEWSRNPANHSVKGLDVLKRQLDDFYSESSQARALTAQISAKVRNQIEARVPAYGEMTKNYRTATNLIKDIEKGLLIKGADTSMAAADSTIKRLMANMKDNSEIRADIMKLMGTKTGTGVIDEAAGYAMSPYVPRGAIGKMFVGGSGFLSGGIVNPQFLAMFASASPKVVGEFSHYLGRLQPSFSTAGTSLSHAARLSAGKWGYQEATQQESQ